MTETETGAEKTRNTGPVLPTRRKGGRTYVAMWCVLGLVAIAYLSALAVAPRGVGLADWTTGLQNGRAGGDSGKLAILQVNMADVRSRIAAAEANINVLQAEDAVLAHSIERVRRAALGNTQGDASLRLATSIPTQLSNAAADDDSAIEGTTLDGVTRTPDTPTVRVTGATGDGAAIAEQKVAAPVPAVVVRPSQQPLDIAAVTGALPLPVGLPKTIKAPPPDPAGSANTRRAPATGWATQTNDPPQIVFAKPAAAPPVPIPVQNAYGVELASGDSVDSLRLSWALLNDRHRDLLGALAPRYVQSARTPDTPYRLIAGPFKSKRGARNLCDQLKAYYVNCRTAGFGGKLL